MSTDTAFGRVAFPRLYDEEQKRTIEQSKTAGHVAGYTEGLRQASEDVARHADDLNTKHAENERHGQARVDRAVALLGAATLALQERTLPLIQQAENTLVSTSLELVEAILGCELDRAEVSARRALERSLNQPDHLDPSEIQVIRMHPEDLVIVGDQTRALESIRFVADSRLARGDAISEFKDGFLDAQIGTALLRAKAALGEVNV